MTALRKILALLLAAIAGAGAVVVNQPAEPLAQQLVATHEDSARSPHWPAFRKAYLEKHPTCAACGGTEQLELHHVLPFSRDKSRELDESNVIPLCQKHGCHFFVGHLCSYYSFNPDVRKDAAAWLKKIQARPPPEKKKDK